MANDGLDESWGFADPAAAKAAGIRVVSMYLSRDPSKNATATKIRAYHAHGIGVLLNWEDSQTGPQRGASQGTADATDAVAQVRALIKAVGYAPKSTLAIPFSWDSEIHGGWAAADAYYGAVKAVVHAAAFHVGVYGDADLCDHLHATGAVDMTWQTLAWSYSRLSPTASFYQSSINNTLGGASVDMDEILNANSLGPWWAPGSPLDSDGFDMTEAQIKQYMTEVLRFELPRIAAVLRFGTQNAAYQAGNASAALVDGHGLQGHVEAAVAAAIKAQPATVATVDAAAVAKAVVEALGAAIVKGEQ